MKQYFFYLLISAVIVEIFADVLFKYWSISSKGILLWSGVLLYGIGTVLWAYSLKFEGLSKAMTIFAVVNLVAISLIGAFIFRENLSLINKVGILLGVISVVLIQI